MCVCWLLNWHRTVALGLVKVFVNCSNCLGMHLIPMCEVRPQIDLLKYTGSKCHSGVGGSDSLSLSLFLSLSASFSCIYRCTFSMKEKDTHKWRHFLHSFCDSSSIFASCAIYSFSPSVCLSRFYAFARSEYMNLPCIYIYIYVCVCVSVCSWWEKEKRLTHQVPCNPVVTGRYAHKCKSTPILPA